MDILRSDERTVALRYLGGAESVACMKALLALTEGDPRRKQLSEWFDRLTILQQAPSPFGDAERVYHFDVRVVGPRVTVLVDGKVVFDVVDDARKDRPAAGGYVGFHNAQPSQMWFDNFRIYRAHSRP